MSGQFAQFGPPIMYTLRQAAKATGKAPNTIRNAIKKGRISASQDDAGQFAISAVELHRIYPPINELHTDRVNLHKIDPPSVPPLNTIEIKALEDKVKLLETTLEDARQDRDEWRKQAQQLALSPPEKSGTGRVLGFLWRK
jgi:hypothetical protein